MSFKPTVNYHSTNSTCFEIAKSAAGAIAMSSNPDNAHAYLGKIEKAVAREEFMATTMEYVNLVATDLLPKIEMAPSAIPAEKPEPTIEPVA